MCLPSLTLLVALFFAPAAAESEGHWPQWRGPDGSGVARSGAPSVWSDTKNVKWVASIPGRGHSTPIVWGDRIFLTTAVPTGVQPVEAAASILSEEGEPLISGTARSREHHFGALCFDRLTGAKLWERKLRTATPHEGYHRTYGSYASISPVTDGRLVYAAFGSHGLFALDFEGNVVWKKHLDARMQIHRKFGEGSSPTIAGDALVLVFDHEGDSFVVALDKRTGEELWRTPRDESSAWTSPVTLEVAGEPQVFTAGTNRMRSYDADTGDVVWECGGLGSSLIPVPVRHEDTIIALGGYFGANVMSVALGFEGDQTDTDSVRWTAEQGVPYTCSPVLYEGRLYTVKDLGFLSCFNATTGAPYYVDERLPRGSQVKASPIAAGGKLYIATESGDVHVIEAGEMYVLLGTNTIEGQLFVASPVVAENELFLRGRKKLYCIADLEE